MFISISGELFVPASNKYRRVILHKNTDGAFYLENTDEIISELPIDYEVLSFQEVVARYGHSAIGNDRLARLLLRLS